MKPRELIAALQAFPEDVELVVSSEWLTSLHRGFVDPPVRHDEADKTRHVLAYRATERYAGQDSVLYFFTEEQRADWLESRPRIAPEAVCIAEPIQPVRVYVLD